MAYKEAKVVLTKDQFSKMDGPAMAVTIKDNISVERAKAFLMQLIGDGVIEITEPQTLYDITYGRVVVEGAGASGISTAGVKASKKVKTEAKAA